MMILLLQEIITATGTLRVFCLGQIGENLLLGRGREGQSNQAVSSHCPSWWEGPAETRWPPDELPMWTQAPYTTGLPKRRGGRGNYEEPAPPLSEQAGLHPARGRLKYMQPKSYLQFTCCPDIRDT